MAWDGALLYLALLERGGDPAQAAAALRWGEERLGRPRGPPSGAAFRHPQAGQDLPLPPVHLLLPAQVVLRDRPPARPGRPAPGRPQDVQPTQERIDKNNSRLDEFWEKQEKGRG